MVHGVTKIINNQDSLQIFK
uniref:Uncharacterized protein n=1 Tax=Arundo donax TaxID=35708 RepID=A0A0A8ZA88_ARUDO